MEQVDKEEIYRKLSDFSNKCYCEFNDKISSYGPSFRVMRQQSINDQLKYKIVQLRNNESGIKTLDSIEDILRSIFNYSIISIIQLRRGSVVFINGEDPSEIIAEFNLICEGIVDLIKEKDVNYGCSWMHMHRETFTDIMLTKTMRSENMIYENTDNYKKSIFDVYMDISAYVLFYMYRLKNDVSTIKIEDNGIQ